MGVGCSQCSVVSDHVEVSRSPKRGPENADLAEGQDNCQDSKDCQFVLENVVDMQVPRLAPEGETSESLDEISLTSRETTGRRVEATSSAATMCTAGPELLRQALQAAAECRVLAAAQALEALRASGSPAGVGEPLLDALGERARRMQYILQAAASTSGEGWKSFDLDQLKVARRHSPSGSLLLVLKWEAEGSLKQQLAALRDCDLLEPFWKDHCWSMTAQHHDACSVVRWLQKDPFTGRKTEVILERVLCDCMDQKSPSWVLLERTPEISGFETFAGKWGKFDIGPVPKGYLRAVTNASGRVIRPISADRCEVEMVLEVRLPSIIRWAVTDSLLVWALQAGAKSTMEAWSQVINGWEQLDFQSRMSANAAFYGRLDACMEEYLRAQAAAQT